MGRIADYIGIDKQKFEKKVHDETEDLTEKFNNTNFLYGRGMQKPLQWVCSALEGWSFCAGRCLAPTLR